MGIQSMVRRADMLLFIQETYPLVTDVYIISSPNSDYYEFECRMTCSDPSYAIRNDLGTAIKKRRIKKVAFFNWLENKDAIVWIDEK